MTGLRAWAVALGGEVSGKGAICPGPGHRSGDRSLSVTPSVAAPNGFLVHSFAGDDPIVCLDYVRAKLGLPEFSPGKLQTRKQGGQTRPAGYIGRTEPKRATSAATLWQASTGPFGTLVEKYLKLRALDLPDEAANEAIRFHPSCPFGFERFPTMICLVRNILSNEPQAIHRTALMPDGTAVKSNGKTFRLLLGPIAGGAIKLDPDEDVAQGLCVGEGVETCLAGRQMGLRPVWSVVNTGGVENFPILPGLDGLHIFRENDANGASARAVEICARRWYLAGRDVVIVDPDLGSDLNDELRREAAR